MTYVVGLSGGIGSGKTVVSDHFVHIGVPVVDTDVIAREVVSPGHTTLAELVQVFGAEILYDNGELNRARLRTIAFESPDNKARLDEITHPAIRQLSLQQIADADYPYCVVVVPLLDFSSEFGAMMDRILVVNAARELRIQRVQQRSGLTRDEVVKIMETQLSDEQRSTFADDVILNEGTIRDAQNEVERLHKLYLNLSSRFANSSV